MPILSSLIPSGVSSGAITSVIVDASTIEQQILDNITTNALFNVYTKSEVDTNNYTKSETNTLLAGKINSSAIGQNNGVCGLNAQGKVPLTNLEASVVEYKGVWNATTNTPNLSTLSPSIGDIYIVSVGGTYNTVSYNQGDWIIFNGSSWDKTSNTSQGDVSTVFSRTGNITAQEGDYSSFYYTKALSDGKYQLLSNMSNYYDKTTSDGKYALSSALSSYLTTANATATYYDKTTSDGKYALQSSLSNYALSSSLSSYLTTANATANYYDKTASDAKYLTITNASANYYDKTTSDGKYLPANNFTATGTSTIATLNLTSGSISTAPTLNAHIANKQYVDQQVATATGGGVVSSVFTRTGNVVAQEGDYSSFYYTKALSDGKYQLASDMTNYLTTVNATSTYYDKTTSDGKYALSSALSSYLTTANATANYYDKTASDAKYALQSSLSSYALSSSLSSYLTTANATSTYYDKTTSDGKYALQTSLSNYLTTANATANYYDKTASDAKYALQTSLSNYALTSSLSSYLTTANATSTYYDKTTSDGKYALQTSLSNYLTTANATTNYYNKTTVDDKISAINSKFGPPILSCSSFNMTSTYMTYNFMHSNSLAHVYRINGSGTAWSNYAFSEKIFFDASKLTSSGSSGSDYYSQYFMFSIEANNGKSPLWENVRFGFSDNPVTDIDGADEQTNADFYWNLGTTAPNHQKKRLYNVTPTNIYFSSNDGGETANFFIGGASRPYNGTYGTTRYIFIMSIIKYYLGPEIFLHCGVYDKGLSSWTWAFSQGLTNMPGNGKFYPVISVKPGTGTGNDVATKISTYHSLPMTTGAFNSFYIYTPIQAQNIVSDTLSLYA